MTKYICTFRLQNPQVDGCVVTERGLSYLKDGFWINEDFELTMGGDAKFFVLPHQITSIEATREDV